jgi:hypothetical protein
MGHFNCFDDIHDRAKTQSLPVLLSVVNYGFKMIITGLGLIDIWKNRNKIDLGRTFHHHFGSFILNRVYADRSFVGNFKKVYLQSLSVNDYQSIQSTLTWNVDLVSVSGCRNIIKLETCLVGENWIIS